MPLPDEKPDAPLDRVMRQLVEAMIYEGLLVPDVKICGTAMACRWRGGNHDFRAKARMSGWDRMRMAPGSLEMRGESGEWTEPDLPTLISCLDAEPDRVATLLGELSQTRDLMQWNRDHVSAKDRRAMRIDELDCALHEGHPYHPCFKSRTGFSPEDHADFGAENGKAFQLIYAAIDRSLLNLHLDRPENLFWQQQLGGADFSALMQAMRRHGLTLASHSLVPLHPWQARLIMDKANARGLDRKAFVLFDPLGDSYRATQSLRTLTNLTHPLRANVKCALSVVSTSSLRNLKPHSVKAAPVLSRWLNAVVAQDAAFAGFHPLRLLGEYAGITGFEHTPLSGDVGVIFRQSPLSKLHHGETAIPLNALMMLESDGRPFMDDMVRQHGLLTWIRRFLAVSILPVWHLFAHHGIGVEAHGQNMLLVLRDGLPQALMLRDFHDSLEFHRGLLKNPAQAPDMARLDPVFADAAPNAHNDVDNVESLRALLVDTLFIYNLAEIAHLLQCHYALSEDRFWSLVHATIAHYRAHHGGPSWAYDAVFAEKYIATESLLARKLVQSEDEIFHLVGNPLIHAHAKAA